MYRRSNGNSGNYNKNYGEYGICIPREEHEKMYKKCLINKPVDPCEYCTNRDEMYELLNVSIYNSDHLYDTVLDNKITVKMNKRRKNWFLELSEKNFDDLIIINYCPMCGRKLGGKDGRTNL